MAQRLVLSATDGVIPFHELAAFVDTARKHGVVNGDCPFEGTKNTVRISMLLPKDVRVVGSRSIKIKKKDKHGQQVDKQIAEHKEKKKNGVEEGYVPPVGRSTAPKPVKVKCTVCNTRKTVTKINGVRVIKPHVSKGEPCEGSGMEI